MSMSYGEFLAMLDAAGAAPASGGTSAPRQKVIGFPSLWATGGLRSERAVNVKVPVLFPFGAKNLRVSFLGNMNGAPNEPPLPNSYSVTGLVEYPPNNIHSPLLFGQSNTGVVIPDGELVSDEVFIDVKPGETVTFRYFVTVAAGAKYPTSLLMWGQFAGSGVDYSGTQVDQTKNLAYAFPFTYEYAFCHTAVIGGTPDDKNVAVMGVGDSIMHGTGSNNLCEGWLGLIIDKTFPFLNLGSPSDVGQYFQGAQARSRLRYTKHADVAVYSYGMNDFLQQKDILLLYKAAISVWTGFVRRGVKVFATTVPPSTTSTDSYMTTAKQTPTNPAFKAGTGAHWQWNTWLRDGAPMRGTLATGFTQVATGTTGADVLRTGQTGHLLTYLIDIAAALETSPGSGIYRPNLNGATEGWYAFDGVHPTDIGCNSIAAECGPALIAKLASLKA